MTQLLEPVRFRGGVETKNRTALAALTNKQSHADGTLSEQESDFLVARATGGFGIVTTCATYVSQEGKAWAGELGLANESHHAGMVRLARDVRAAGALPFVQIFHGGLRADEKVSGLEPISALGAVEPPKRRQATTEDLERVVAAFREAAVQAHAAGMAGVEIHGAHGYLLAQFVSTVENRRDDEWGGSLENRARLLRQVTRAAREATPPDFVVGVRLSPEDFGQTRGVDLDENVQIARWLEEDGIDYLHLSLWDVTRNTAKYPEQHALPLFRAALRPDTRIFAAGKIWSKADAERVLELGADVVALGRSGILNPDWPARVASGDAEPARPPMSRAELGARAVSPIFAEYLTVFKGLVEG